MLQNVLVEERSLAGRVCAAGQRSAAIVPRYKKHTAAAEATLRVSQPSAVRRICRLAGVDDRLDKR